MNLFEENGVCFFFLFQPSHLSHDIEAACAIEVRTACAGFNKRIKGAELSGNDPLTFTEICRERYEFQSTLFTSGNLQLTTALMRCG
jgi:hypothetical protein